MQKIKLYIHTHSLYKTGCFVDFDGDFISSTYFCALNATYTTKGMSLLLHVKTQQVPMAVTLFFFCKRQKT